MQVSWIDPEEVRALLENIEGPRKVVAANNIAWEVHTLPVVPLPPAQDNLIDPPSAKVSPPPLPPEMPLSDGSSGPRGGELWRIRENLRSLREQAQFSGLLPKSDPPTAPVIAPAPVAPEVPAPPPLPEPPPAAPEPTSVEEDLVIQLAEAIEQRAAQPIEPEVTPPPAPAAPVWIDQTPAPAPEPFIQPPVIEAPSPPKQPTPTARLVEIAFSPTPTLGEECEPLFSSSLPAEAPAPAAPEAIQTPADALASLLNPEPIPASPLVSSSPSPSPAKPAFVVPMLGLSDRLNALALWTCERLGTQEVLLVDDYGDVLWGGHAQTPLVLSAMMAWHAGQRATAGLACTEPQRIDKILSNGRALTVLPARTRYGTVSLAAIQSGPMTPEDERAIREALVSAVEGPVDQPSA